MRSWGLDTEVRSYTVWMPHATSVKVWRTAPDVLELDLREPSIPGDPASALAQFPTANGYGAQGDAEGELVYVNYGLAADYARLDSLGVSVKDRVVIARYGRAFRGIKAREAEKRGAKALIIYSDPADDGAARGAVYPDGPFRPAGAVQRGSVYNGAGDPSTPNYASHRGVRRAAAKDMQVPRIPVVAMSYANAAQLLRGMGGKPVPEGWQGGLEFPYHTGPEGVKARVAVQTDSAQAPYKEIWNTFGVLRGSDLPDEMVIVGAHRDAWGPGTSDDVSGVAAVMEAARMAAEEARAGNRPRRTLVFATWDAEEWGLIGSTEYVEDDSVRLRRGAVAYLNVDVAVSGPEFGGSGTPSMRALVRDAARQVPSPDGEGSVYDGWRRAAQVAEGSEPQMSDPGGGSDFAGFYNHLGIPHADWGFGGALGVYHSQYDSPGWMEKFGDPGYRRHAAAAQVGTALMLRLANAPVLPYDYQEFARTLKGYLPSLDSALVEKKWDVTSAPLAGALDRFERAANTWTTARDQALASGEPRARVLERTNAALMRVERVLVRGRGLKSRPWYRNLVYASDPDNGYATLSFPGIREAVRAADRRIADEEIAELATRLNFGAEALFAAADAIAATDDR
jgi:N-acetylated-alpha-linked acidic dipeptidase